MTDNRPFEKLTWTFSRDKLKIVIVLIWRFRFEHLVGIYSYDLWARRNLYLCQTCCDTRLRLLKSRLKNRPNLVTLYHWMDTEVLLEPGSPRDLNFWCCLFVCLPGVYRPTREFFTHMETSLVPVKGCKFWPMLGTHGHWAVRVL